MSARLIAWLALAATGLLLACEPASLARAQDGRMQTVDVQGRVAYLYSPPDLAERPAPLVLALHGGLGNAEQFQKAMPLFQQADRQGFRVAYLQGSGGGLIGRLGRATWNAGGCCGPAARQNADDVGYIADVIQILSRQGLVEGGPVYLVGHSNGAMMSYRFACERPDMVAGVISISGTLLVPCRKVGGVRILHIHGAEDKNVPPEGGVGQGPARFDFPSVAQTVRRLREAGADVELLIVPGASHPLQQVEQGLRREGIGDLGEIIGSFIR